jgi:RHS repeat-associated protein
MRSAYGPFGEAYAQTGSADLSFTGMNQDTVSNLYDFPAREYGVQGRWPSPDPAGISSAKLTDPQSWNRYAYVRNSPLTSVDPTGEDGCEFMATDTSACAQEFDWEGDFGWGTSYYFEGMQIPGWVAQSLLSGDAAYVCPGACEGFGTNDKGQTKWAEYGCYAGGSGGDVCAERKFETR